MAADEHRKIVTRDIENKLAFVSLVLVDRHFTDVEVLENILQRRNGRVGNTVELLVSQLDRFPHGFPSALLLFDNFISHGRLLR